jgi:hypothetical protein
MAREHGALWRYFVEEGSNVAGKAVPIVLPIWIVWQAGAAMAAQIKGRNGATNGFGYRP